MAAALEAKEFFKCSMRQLVVSLGGVALGRLGGVLGERHRCLSVDGGRKRRRARRQQRRRQRGVEVVLFLVLGSGENDRFGEGEILWSRELPQVDVIGERRRREAEVEVVQRVRRHQSPAAIAAGRNNSKRRTLTADLASLGRVGWQLIKFFFIIFLLISLFFYEKKSKTFYVVEIF